MNDEYEDNEENRGDGGSEDVSDSLLDRLKKSITGICSAAQYTGWRRRQMAENVRYCRWAGMSADGRKHEEDLGEKPFPFEGASDGRVRTSDTVVNFLVAVLVNAATTARARFTGVESSDSAWAAKMTVFLRYLMRNFLKNGLRRELIKTAQFMLSDSPGASVMHVYWDRQVALESKTITVMDLVKELAAAMKGQLTEQQVADLADLIRNPEREEQAIQMLAAGLPHLKRARLKKMLAQLRESGEADYPQPRVVRNGPKQCALRIFEDIFFNSDVLDDIQRAPEIMIPEWLWPEEARAKGINEGWSEDFIEELLAQKGKDAFEGLYKNREDQGEIEGDYSEATYERIADSRKDQVQVVHAMFKEVNEDGMMGLYKVTFSAFTNTVAKEKEILDTPGAQYPCFYFPREVLTRRILDSRGLPESLMTHQNALKGLFDSIGDICSLTLPPVKVPRRRPNLQLVLGPLAQVKEDRPGEIEFMKLPNYPSAAESHREEIRRQIAEYTGVPISDKAGPMATPLLQFAVDGFLDVWGDCLMFMLKLCQAYWTDEEIQRIVGGKREVQVIRTKQELDQQYDLMLAVDVRDMDNAYLMEKVKNIKEMVLPMDTGSRVNRDLLVERIFEMIDPNLAEDVIESRESATSREVEDEELNFMKIKTGIQPPMITEGQNFPLRLQVIRNIMERNPEAYKEMGETSRAMLEQWMKYRQQMVQQMENATIGRTGARQVI